MPRLDHSTLPNKIAGDDLPAADDLLQLALERCGDEAYQLLCRKRETLCDVLGDAERLETPLYPDTFIAMAQFLGDLEAHTDSNFSKCALHLDVAGIFSLSWGTIDKTRVTFEFLKDGRILCGMSNGLEVECSNEAVLFNDSAEAIDYLADTEYSEVMSH